MATTGPSDPGRDGDGEAPPALGAGASLHERVAAVEDAIRALSDEVTTRRLVVADGRRDARLVAEVVGGTVELRLEVTETRRLPPDQSEGRINGQIGARAHGPTAAVVLHAGDDWLSWAESAPAQGFGTGPGAMVGLQVWAQGDALVELDAWPDADDSWHPHVHLGGPS